MRWEGAGRGEGSRPVPFRGRLMFQRENDGVGKGNSSFSCWRKEGGRERGREGERERGGKGGREGGEGREWERRMLGRGDRGPDRPVRIPVGSYCA